MASANYKLFDFTEAGYEFFRNRNDTSEELYAVAEFNVLWSMENVTDQNHPEDMYADENGMYEFRDMHREKDAFRRRYGPVSAKRFLGAMRECVDTFKRANGTLGKRRKFILKMWSLQKMYLLILESFPLLVVRMKQMLFSIYEQSVKLRNEILKERKTKKMAKYAKTVLELMDEVRAKTANHFTENIWMIMCLRPNERLYFAETATPEMLRRLGHLHKRYWLPEDVARAAAPKYYHRWTDFWTPFLTRNLHLGGDVCRLIAEYIPEKIEGSTFLDFFRRHFNMKEYEYTTQWMPFTVNQTFTRMPGYMGDEYASDITVIINNVFSDFC